MTLKETDIRPDDLKREQLERFAADIRRLIARKDEFVTVSCPACAASAASVAFHKFDLTYRQCEQCGTIYVSPRPTPAILEHYYRTSENYQYWNTHTFPASEAARREKIFRPRAQRLIGLCKGYGVNPGTFLEVGAGFGTFCEEMLASKFFTRVLAVEPTPDLAATCRKKGIEVLDRPVEQLQFDHGTADVVAAFEVIEHLFSPRQFLDACRGLLTQGGVLVLTTPNVEGFDVKLLAEASDTFDVEHLNYFHPESISGLLTSCGFQVLEVLTPGELDAELARKKILAGERDLAGQPFLKRVLIDEWDRLGAPFQAFLSENRLSSHMWVVARRP